MLPILPRLLGLEINSRQGESQDRDHIVHYDIFQLQTSSHWVMDVYFSEHSSAPLPWVAIIKIQDETKLFVGFFEINHYPIFRFFEPGLVFHVLMKINLERNKK